MVNFFLGIGVINENSKQIGTFTGINQLYEAKDLFFLKKTLWPFFMDGVQLPQGYSHFEEAV